MNEEGDDGDSDEELKASFPFSDSPRHVHSEKWNLRRRPRKSHVVRSLFVPPATALQDSIESVQTGPDIPIKNEPGSKASAGLSSPSSIAQVPVPVPVTVLSIAPAVSGVLFSSPDPLPVSSLAATFEVVRPRLPHAGTSIAQAVRSTSSLSSASVSPSSMFSTNGTPSPPPLSPSPATFSTELTEIPALDSKFSTATPSSPSSFSTGVTSPADYSISSAPTVSSHLPSAVSLQHSVSSSPPLLPATSSPKSPSTPSILERKSMQILQLSRRKRCPMCGFIAWNATRNCSQCTYYYPKKVCEIRI